MSKVTQAPRDRPLELGLSLEELIRRGARDVIEKAMEAELAELLATYRDEGRRAGQGRAGQGRPGYRHSRSNRAELVAV